MIFEILTLFPEYYEVFFRVGLMKKAVESDLIHPRVFNIRDHGEGKSLRVDDNPYGGLPGMLLKYDVMQSAYSQTKDFHTILFSPRGEVLKHHKVMELAKCEGLILICGHYEGVDERFIRDYVDEELSIGDYVMSGGEMPSLVLMEAIGRQLEQFVGNDISRLDESFADSWLLEYDQYTRPSVIKRSKEIKKNDKIKDGIHREVPEVLLSGDHKRVEKWLWENKLINTYKRRADLWRNLSIDDGVLEVIKNYLKKERIKN